MLRCRMTPPTRFQWPARVIALQSMVTRVVRAFDPAVVTVTTIQAGTASNVIPESVICEGTVRPFLTSRGLWC